MSQFRRHKMSCVLGPLRDRNHMRSATFTATTNTLQLTFQINGEFGTVLWVGSYSFLCACYLIAHKCYTFLLKGRDSEEEHRNLRSDQLVSHPFCILLPWLSSGGDIIIGISEKLSVSFWVIHLFYWPLLKLPIMHRNCLDKTKINLLFPQGYINYCLLHSLRWKPSYLASVKQS